MNKNTLTNRELTVLLKTFAEMYRDNLENKNIMFVFGNDKLDFIETAFTPDNFQHLTGISYFGVRNTERFYNICLSEELQENRIIQNNPKLIKLKFDVLSQTMKIHKTANMIGSYNGNSYSVYSELDTKKLAGSENACLGFIPIKDYYIPNTNLNTSIFPNKLKYLLSNDKSPILLTFRKNITEEKYTELTHFKKNLDLTTLTLPIEIRNKINVSEFNFSDKNKEKQEIADPELSDFRIERQMGGKFDVTYREKTLQYELTHGSDNINRLAEVIAKDFNTSQKLALKIIKNAEEQNKLEKLIVDENIPQQLEHSDKDLGMDIDENDIND
ncbi:MAG: hypothetical protein LBM93_05535 [Oscillospiraceae bacterium]|nr:hypothetical protein [Oscillospiraceae bacterium]